MASASEIIENERTAVSNMPTYRRGAWQSQTEPKMPPWKFDQSMITDEGSSSSSTQEFKLATTLLDVAARAGYEFVMAQPDGNTPGISNSLST